MSGVTMSQRSTRSQAAGSATLPWLNNDAMPVSETPTTTASGGTPTAAITASSSVCVISVSTG
jgi:hypothetical protein